MITMFDYKRFSVLEYNEMIQKWYLECKEPSTNIFKYDIKSVQRNANSMYIQFTNNHWIKVDKSGWWCEAYDHNVQDVISNRNFYLKNRTSESLGLGRIAYTSRPAKGITYKNIMIDGADITRNDNRVRVFVNGNYTFGVSTFKKYREYQLSTQNGISFYEKVNNAGVVLKTTLNIRDGNDYYCLSINRRKDNSVGLYLSKDYKKDEIIQMPFKDCDIDNLFNKYMMFNFELTAEQSQFTIVEKMRTLLKDYINDTHENLKEKGLNTTIINGILKRLEVIESDEHQVQRRA